MCVSIAITAFIEGIKHVAATRTHHCEVSEWHYYFTLTLTVMSSNSINMKSDCLLDIVVPDNTEEQGTECALQ